MAKFCIQVAWSDVPHLSVADIEDLRKEIPIHQLEAREKGVPVLGSGVIYPLAENAFVIDPISIPDWWPRAYAMDVGWNCTAALWGAWDRDSDTIYLYSEHYRGQAEPSIHADAIKARGDWMWGAIDPAAAGASQTDGKQLIREYEKLGLNLVPADNAVEAGIHAVYQRLSSGRLKVFRTLQNWLTEVRIYRRDELGKVIKNRDHLMDCTKYLVQTAMKFADIQPETKDKEEQKQAGQSRSAVTGY